MLRGGLLAAGFGLSLGLPVGDAQAQDGVVGATFRDETQAYRHCILGDCIEWSTLEIVGRAPDGTLTTRQFQPGLGAFVFEDITPREWDVTGDGQPEVVVILTSVTRGASLAVFSAERLIAQTPFIGQANRWLAPVGTADFGAADFDDDGRMEVAFVDRPHLAKVLRVFEWDGAGLVLDTEIGGLTNHRIGEDFISGGLRDCGEGPEMVTADGDWSDVMVTAFVGPPETGQWVSRSVAAFSVQALADAMVCR